MDERDLLVYEEHVSIKVLGIVFKVLKYMKIFSLQVLCFTITINRDFKFEGKNV